MTATATRERPPLTERALASLRTITQHGSPADVEQARAILRERGYLADPDGDLRARIRAGGPQLLGELLMPDTMSGPRSPLHEFLNTWHLAEGNSRPAARCAVAAPRGHGKSTAGVEVAAVWHAAHCTRRFQVIISDTDDQAIARIAAIKAHVESNDELRRLYPKLRPAFARLSADPTGDLDGMGPWRERDIVFACGCRISARGAGVAMRGMKHRETRPDLVYLDDLEDEKSVATPYQIGKRLKWLQRVALGLANPMTGMSVLWVGTILSRDALLNLATGAALDEGQARPAWARAWIARVFRAEVDGTERIPTTATVTDPDTGATFTLTRDVGEPMWAGALTREDLCRIRGELGDESYAAEYLADPVDGAGGMIVAPRPVSVLNPDASPTQRVVRMPDGSIVPVAAMVRGAALDPQYAKPGESADPDLAAAVVVGVAGPNAFILDSWIGRDRAGQAGQLIARATAWGCYAAAVERNAAQIVTADQAAAMGRLPVIPRQATEGKVARALKLATYAQQGRLFILSAQGQNNELVAYLTAFPHGRFKDPVDGTVMALDVATEGPQAQTGSGPAVGGVRHT